MRHLIALAALGAALVVTSAASAGGWATVGIAPLADGVNSGDTWRPEITVLQHGRTPLDGLRPTLAVSAGTDTRTFMAKPTGKTGVYVVDVVFPRPGQWSVVVESGFGDSRLTYGPVTIGGPAVAAPGGFPVLPVAVAGGVLALAAAAAFGARRTRRLGPASG